MDLASGLRNGLSGGLWVFVFIKFINHGGLPYSVVNQLTIAGTATVAVKPPLMVTFHSRRSHVPVSINQKRPSQLINFVVVTVDLLSSPY